jgi:hypothetical protein
LDQKSKINGQKYRCSTYLELMQNAQDRSPNQPRLHKLAFVKILLCNVIQKSLFLSEIISTKLS